jgi:hypothetical protein
VIIPTLDLPADHARVRGTQGLWRRRCLRGWRWLREDGEQRRFVLADRLTHVVGEDAFRCIDGQMLALDREAHPSGMKIIQE